MFLETPILKSMLDIVSTQALNLGPKLHSDHEKYL